MEIEEVTAMGLIDRNMAAFLESFFGPIATVHDVDEALGVYGFKTGTAQRLLTFLTSDTESVVDCFTFQAMFPYLYPHSFYDRHALFLR